MPDPASRFQPEDVHGRSEVVDPEAFGWRDDGWQGLPWEAMVFYELHVGAFTPEGTFRAAQDRLDYLADLGITAVQLMPVADFPGRWNWGYDGVFPFAPNSRYGRPEDLKALVQDCHARGLALFLDVVYNHFGPEGNYLGLYAPEFFSARYSQALDPPVGGTDGCGTLSLTGVDPPPPSPPEGGARAQARGARADRSAVDPARRVHPRGGVGAPRRRAAPADRQPGADAAPIPHPLGAPRTVPGGLVLSGGKAGA